MVPAHTTSMPSRVGPLCAPVKADERRRLLFTVSAPLDFEIDHLGHDAGADAHPDQAADTGNDKAFLDEKAFKVAGVYRPDDAEHEEGQRANDVSRRLGLRRHRADLEFHLGALAQDVGQVGQRFGQIAAGFALDLNRDTEELEFGSAEHFGRFL